MERARERRRRAKRKCGPGSVVVSFGFVIPFLRVSRNLARMTHEQRAQLIRERYLLRRPSAVMRHPRKPAIIPREPPRRWANERRARNGFKAEVSGPVLCARQPRWVAQLRKLRERDEFTEKRLKRESALTRMSRKLLVKPKREA